MKTLSKTGFHENLKKYGKKKRIFSSETSLAFMVQTNGHLLLKTFLEDKESNAEKDGLTI